MNHFYKKMGQQTAWNWGAEWLKKSLFLCLVLATFVASAQSVTVSGKITDATDGSGLPGVTIQEKGTSNGTTTDFDGNFQLTVSSSDAVLVISSVGFASQEIVVGNQTFISISLTEDVTALGEIVVIGYGTVQKSDLTGSVDRINSENLNPGPITNPLQQLNGRAAGVNINQVGSEPGQGPAIRIRGITSLIGGNDPLVVVDGVQGDMGLLRQVPPSEIESVEILKDASATAIYGSRGAAGVVIITTKKGVRGTAQVEYAGVYSFESISNSYDMMNADQWRFLAAERGISESADYGGDTDWFDEITRNGSTQTHNVAISGGNENFTYRSSITAILQEGIILNSSSENYIARFQGTQTLNDKVSFTFNLNTSTSVNDYNGAGRIGEALDRRPTDPIYTDNPLYDDTGDYFIDPNSFAYINPLARTKEIVDGDRTNNLLGSMRLDYKIIDGLTASAFGSWRRTARKYESYTSARTTLENARNIGDASTVPDINDLPDGIAFQENNYSDEKLYNLILNYEKSFGDHSFNFVGVNEYQIQTYEGNSLRSRGFLVDNEGNLQSMQAADPTLFIAGDVRSYKSDRKLASFLGRVNYSFKDRYYISASFRRDGSSVFGANNKWANFFATSVAWRISDEAFMSSVGFIDNLKLRVGYGETGNQQGLGPLNSVRLANTAGTAFFGGSLISNFAITQNENADLRWEVKKMYNAGIDFGLMDSKLTGTVDFFYGKTSDLLFDYQVPQPPYPFGTIKANIGEVLNQGIELSLNYYLIDEADWGVTLGGNLSSIRTEVLDLNGSLNGLPLETDYVVWGSGGTTGVASTNNAINHLIIGQPLGAFYLFKHAGVDQDGNQIIDDLDGDGVVEDGNRENDDRYLAGQPLPKLTWAFTPTARFKSFDMSMVLRGALGHQIYNARKATLSTLSGLGQRNMLVSAASTGIENITYASDYWLEDGDYIRLENLSFGYNVNTANIKTFKSLRVSFIATNLFVITKYSGIDPELSVSGGGGFGIDYGIYPRTRSYAIGVNATF